MQHTLQSVSIGISVALEQFCKLKNTIKKLLEWMFTTIPEMFGLVPGCATLTGWALVLVLTIMFVFSLPFVRKSGNFEVSLLFRLNHMFKGH